MKQQGLLFFLAVLLCFGPVVSSAGQQPDFTVTGIQAGGGFVQIKLQNRGGACTVPGNAKEKIFLTIYIDNIKRTEYKLKYMPPKLFTPRGTVLFRTNFRYRKGLRITAEINRLKVVPETNYTNNKMTSVLP